MRKYSWGMIFRDFKRRHPDLCERGMQYFPYEPMVLQIVIPKRGRLLYSWFGDKITWLARYEDLERTKREEREQRPDLYQRFLSEIDWYQNETGASQGDIARISGVSRQSINRYLSGTVMPKTSTMRKICESLGIDI